MRKFAGTWVVLVAFAGLLAWFLIAKPKSADERKEASLTVAKSDRDSIDRIEITNGNGSFELVRVSGGPTPTPVAKASPAAAATPTPAPEVWRLTKPSELPVEDTALNQMKNALAELVAVDPVWKDATDAQLDQVGLKDGATAITWHAKDGDHGLLLGKNFPKGEEVYVRAKDSKAVYVARKWSVEIFTKSLADFRRHKLFDLDRDAVTGVTIETPSHGTMTATRADVLAPWKATGALVGRPDKGRMNNVVARVANLRADDFPAGIDLKKAGLDKPRATITLATSDGKKATLLVGGDAPNGKWYAKDAASDAIVLASAQIPNELTEPFPQWRDKSLMDFPVDEVSTLELTYLGSTLGFHTDDTKMWQANGDSKNAVNAEVTQFLRTIKSANVNTHEIAKSPAAYGFDKPELTASWVVGSGATAQKMEIVVGSMKSNAHWVKTSEYPDEAQLVATDLLSAAKALKDAAMRPPMVTTTASTASTKGT